MDILRESAQQHAMVAGATLCPTCELPEDMLALVLGQLPVGVGLLRILHNQFALVYANQKFREWTGLGDQVSPSEHFVWQPVPDGPGVEQRLLHVWQTGEPWRYVGPIQAVQRAGMSCGLGKQSKDLMVELCYQLWLNGDEQPQGLLVTVRSIAVSHKPERPYLGGFEQAHQARLNQAQEEGIEGAQLMCPEMGSQAGCTYQRKLDLCVAMLGHDLRNPLSAIQLSAHLLKRHRNHGSSMALQRIIDSSTRMQRMVEQLLDFVRIRWHSGLPLSCSLIDLTDLVEDIQAEWRLCRPENPITFVTRGNTQAWVDKDRISQMISNMLGNALQHSEVGSEISLWLQGQLGEKGEIIFGIRNTAYIDAERLQHIFQPFTHDKQQAVAKCNGLGLGLFIAEQVVLAHGGRVEVDSCPIQGTTFQVFLPRYPVASVVG